MSTASPWCFGWAPGVNNDLLVLPHRFSINPFHSDGTFFRLFACSIISRYPSPCVLAVAPWLATEFHLSAFFLSHPPPSCFFAPSYLFSVRPQRSRFSSVTPFFSLHTGYEAFSTGSFLAKMEASDRLFSTSLGRFISSVLEPSLCSRSSQSLFTSPFFPLPHPI